MGGPERNLRRRRPRSRGPNASRQPVRICPDGGATAFVAPLHHTALVLTACCARHVGDVGAGVKPHVTCGEHMRTLSNQKRGRAAHRSVTGLVALTLLGVSACNDILSVDLPTRVPDAALNDPAMSSVLVQGAIADFECALANYASATGLLTDELVDATGWIAVTMWDQRRIFPDNTNLGSSGCTTLGYGVYTPLQTARFQAADVGKRITAFPDAEVPNKPTLLATVAAIEGYAITLLVEGFCEIAIDRGPGLTHDESLAIAEARFTTAIDLATTAGAQ